MAIIIVQGILVNLIKIYENVIIILLTSYIYAMPNKKHSNKIAALNKPMLDIFSKMDLGS